MNNIGASRAGWKGYALVRDANGNPKIDNPETLPKQLRDMLTDEEYLKIYGKKRT